MKEDLDKESKKEISSLEKRSEISQSEAWREVKRILVDKIIDLQSVMNIDAKNADEIALQVSARRTASEILAETIRDIEGSHEQLKSILKGKERSNDEFLKVDD